MADNEPLPPLPFLHPAELFKDEPSPPAPESVGSTQRAATVGALYPKLTLAEALAAVAYRPLPLWPACNTDPWQLARDAFSWAVAVAEIYGDQSDDFITRAMVDSHARGDALHLAGWQFISTAFRAFFKTPTDNDAIPLT